MVDFRPLLLLNALALMLLVTAGFASVRDEQPITEAPAPVIEAVAESTGQHSARNWKAGNAGPIINAIEVTA